MESEETNYLELTLSKMKDTHKAAGRTRVALKTESRNHCSPPVMSSAIAGGKGATHEASHETAV
jgi:hypothetical protein